jgi:hypothetical protein
VDGASDLAAQLNLLVSVLQAAMGVTVAVATVYYALRTSDLVEASRVESLDRNRRRLEGAIGQLIGSALAATAAAGGLAPLVVRDWHRFQPGVVSSRERFSLVFVGQVTTHLAEAARWAGEVAQMSPSLRQGSEAVMDRAVEAFDRANRGDVEGTQGCARALHTASVDLRQMASAMLARIE